ncbi:FliO/MopB family protein [bacterium]|nr:FliO/MopB family protein [bacterium]
MAVLILAALPSQAHSETQTDGGKPQPVKLRDSVLADLADPAVNPMQAINVLLGNSGERQAGLRDPKLLSQNSMAVIGSAQPQQDELERRLAELQLLRSREHMNALTMAMALDTDSGQRFSMFPDSLAGLLTPEPAGAAQTIPTEAHAPAVGSKSGAGVRNAGQARIAGPDSDPPSFRDALTTDEAPVVAGDPIDPQYREQAVATLTAMLDSLPDPDAQNLATSPEVGSEIAGDSPATDEPLYGGAGMDDGNNGYHGLLDLSGGDADEDSQSAGHEPGSAVSSFGVKMAIFTIGLLLLASFLKGRGNPLARLSKRSMKVLETVSLGPGRQIMIVETASANLVLGVTSGGINLLQSLPTDPAGLSRDSVEDIISRESAADEDSWKRRPELDLLDSATLRGEPQHERSGGFTVSQLRNARAREAAGSTTAAETDFASRVRRQLERVRS